MHFQKNSLCKLCQLKVAKKCKRQQFLSMYELCQLNIGGCPTNSICVHYCNLIIMKRDKNHMWIYSAMSSLYSVLIFNSEVMQWEWIRWLSELKMSSWAHVVL
jgi:hypothetical protein